MTQFHTDDYIDFLSRVTPENMEQFQKEQAKCNKLFDSLERHCIDVIVYS
jgi:histone deacetylase 1/2